MHVRSRRSFLAGLALTLASLAVGATPAAAAGTYRYPSARCPDTGPKGLQACVDAAAPGSTIIIVDEVVDESVYVGKSLTLRGDSRRYRPILFSIGFGVDSGGSAVRLAIEDVRVRRRIYASRVDSGSGHRFTFRRVEVGRGEPDAQGLSVAAEVPVTVVVEDSWLSSGASQTRALAFYAMHAAGTSRVRAVGNRISQAGKPLAGSGVSVYADGAGTTEVDIHNNSIHDAAQDGAGGASGILVHATGVPTVDVDVVGNTVAGSKAAAFTLWNTVGVGGRVVLDLFDNSFTHSLQGVVISERVAGTTSLRSGYNNTYRNTLTDYYQDRGRGAGDIHKDPRFVDLADGDLRLRASSPLVDRGKVCQPGGLVIRDAAGRHRLAGSSIDIGAFERGGRSGGGKVVMGTSRRDVLRGSKGADILCGMGGDDRLCARDRTTGNDFVDGGSGRDRATVDRRDRRRSIEATGGC